MVEFKQILAAILAFQLGFPMGAGSREARADDPPADASTTEFVPAKNPDEPGKIIGEQSKGPTLTDRMRAAIGTLPQDIHALAGQTRHWIQIAKHPQEINEKSFAERNLPALTDESAAELDRKLGQLIPQIEKAIELREFSTQLEVPTLAIEIKVFLINELFKVITHVHIIRILRGKPAGSDTEFGLQVSKKMFRKLPGFAEVVHDRAQTSTFRLVATPVEGHSDRLRITLSPGSLYGLKIGTLAAHADSESFLTLIQYMAIQQLIGNLVEMRELKSDPDAGANHWPVIDSALTKKLSAIDDVSTFGRERTKASREPKLRSSLKEALEKVFAKFENETAFANANYVRKVVNILSGPSPTTPVADPAIENETSAVVEELRTLLSESEKLKLRENIEQELVNSSEILISLSEKDLAPALARIVSAAAADGIFQKLMDYLEDSESDYSPQQKIAIMESIEPRQETYEAEIEEICVQWIRELPAQATSTLNSRKAFIGKVIESSRNLSRYTSTVVTGQNIEPSIMVRLAENGLFASSPSEVFTQWTLIISGNVAFDPKNKSFDEKQFPEKFDYAASKRMFNLLLKEIAGDAVFSQAGKPDETFVPALVEKFIRADMPRPVLTLPFSDPSWAESKRLVDLMAQAEKKDLEDLVKLGVRLQFHRNLDTAKPTVDQIFPERADRKAYLALLQDSLLTQFPLLAEELFWKGKAPIAPWFWELFGSRKVRLYEAIDTLVRTPLSHSEIEKRAGLLVDFALSVAEQKVFESVTKLGKVKSVQEVEAMLAQSAFMGLILNSYPVFEDFRHRVLMDLTHPSILEALMKKSGGPTLWAFGAIALVTLLKFKFVGKFFPLTQKVADVLFVGLKPVGKVVVDAIMIVCIADGVNRVRSLIQHSRDADLMQDLYLSDAVESNFFDFGITEATQSAYRTHFWSQMAFTLLDIWVLHGMTTSVLAKSVGIPFVADVWAFKALKLPPGFWSQVPESFSEAKATFQRATDAYKESLELLNPAAKDFLEAQRAARKTYEAATQSYRDAMNAYTRLRKRILAGEDWSYSNIRRLNPLTPVDKKIVKAMKKLGRLRNHAIGEPPHGVGVQIFKEGAD